MAVIFSVPMARYTHPRVTRARNTHTYVHTQVELVRQLPVPRTLPEPEEEDKPAPPPKPASPPPVDANEEHYLKHEARITTMKSFGEKLACPGTLLLPVV